MTACGRLFAINHIRPSTTLDASPTNPIIQSTLMGMGSPENRRKADGSYQTQGVGRGFFVPGSRPRKGGQWRGFLFP